MNLKKLAAFAVTAVMAMSVLGMTVFATDPVGTDPTTLKDGEKTSASIPYDDSANSYNASDYFDNGSNYKDFKYTAESDGTLIIKFDAAIDKFCFRVFDSDKQAVPIKEFQTKTGSYFFKSDGKGGWSESAGLYSGEFKYNVKKGTYYIRINRDIDGKFGGDGKNGNGRVHITCEMDLPKAPTNIKTSVSGTSVKFTWTEPNGCTSYDLRYRLAGTEKWTVKSNINDNNVTVNNLKASKEYEYQMRSYKGKTAGNWGKTGKFKTSGAAYSGKLGVPSAKSVTITWNEVDNALSYEIRYKAGNGNWTTKSVESNSYTISVSAGKTYTYSIRAVNGKNKGEWSENKTVNT